MIPLDSKLTTLCKTTVITNAALAKTIQFITTALYELTLDFAFVMLSND